MRRQRKSRQFPVSQRELAVYLGISGTLLSMIETGRHGARELNSGAILKMTNLLSVHEQSKKAGAGNSSLRKIQNDRGGDGARLAERLVRDADYADHRIAKLKQQLDTMISKEQASLTWFHTVDLLLGKLSPGRESIKDRRWLEYHQHLVMKKVAKNGQVAQAKLEIKIEMEKARARIYSDAAKKLLKK